MTKAVHSLEADILMELTEATDYKCWALKALLLHLAYSSSYCQRKNPLLEGSFWAAQVSHYSCYIADESTQLGQRELAEV